MAEREMRAVYAQTLTALAASDPRVCVVEADLARATGTGAFAKVWPGRFFNVGVAEANLVGVASGLAATGKRPFAATFGCFASRRAYDQFFLSANYAGLEVVLVGTDPGVTAAYNGGTHMPFEDLALMRAVPRLAIVEPADPVSLEAAVRLALERRGCTYLRLQRKPAPELYPAGEVFEFGKSKLLRPGKDVLLAALGALMVGQALAATEALAAEGIEAAVLDVFTLAPLDRRLILQLARATGRVVTCENHRVTGGLGSAVAELLAEEGVPARLRRIGAGADEFGEVGSQDWLADRFHLTAPHIAAAARDLMKGA
ncbi:MAG TPA: transketolase C-terminal domain-containing protein [Magnetospirillaceae bacterium]|nr:transketolase C-terminal domain-containing protein [Magnetospirillaceae bacterium]